MINKFGIPCSQLKDKIKDVEIFCTSEEEAMALAAGAWLATGKKATVYMQNSGLCRSLDIVLSLFKPYEIPLPKLILSVRHKPKHHYYVGLVTWKILTTMGYFLNSGDVEIIEEK